MCTLIYLNIYQAILFFCDYKQEWLVNTVLNFKFSSIMSGESDTVVENAWAYKVGNHQCCRSALCWCGSGSASEKTDPHWLKKRIRIQLLISISVSLISPLCFSLSIFPFFSKMLLLDIKKFVPFISAALYATRIRFLRHDPDPAK